MFNDIIVYDKSVYLKAVVNIVTDSVTCQVREIFTLLFGTLSKVTCTGYSIGKHLATD